MEKVETMPFKVNHGLPGRIYEQLVELAGRHGWDSVYTLSADSIKVADWVQLKCQFGCSYYNKSWCCPPATPEPEKIRKILQEYDFALVLAGRQQNKHIYSNKNRRRANQVRYWKETVSLERFLFLQGYYKCFSLISGPCSLCRECAYPVDCHFPKERRPSVESFSIDVITTLQNLGLTTPVAEKVSDVYYHYAFILVE